METVDDAVLSAIRLRIKEMQVLANQPEKKLPNKWKSAVSKKRRNK